MMKNLIMALAVKNGLPVVPGAHHVSDQGEGLYVAYGPIVSDVAGKWKHFPVYAFMWEAKPGLYAVFADETAFATIDPLGTGKPMTEWMKANLAQWPTGTGWRKGASTLPTADPTIPASCGPIDLTKVLTEEVKTVISI